MCLPQRSQYLKENSHPHRQRNIKVLYVISIFKSCQTFVGSESYFRKKCPLTQFALAKFFEALHSIACWYTYDSIACHVELLTHYDTMLCMIIHDLHEISNRWDLILFCRATVWFLTARSLK